ncbi:XRE family transcriptional regulator, partial [Listeria monocytogenes]|nr:XRE family transcriptional regulator [Listeria monocytogenes]
MRTSFKLIRNKNGLTQKELAEKVGLAEISIRKIENGERDPSI